MTTASAAESPGSAPAPTRSRGIPRWRLGLLAVLVVISLGTGAAYKLFWLDHPIGTGPAGPAVPREPFAQVWTERPVLLVGLGDSVTAGYGASPGLSYVSRLARNPKDDFADVAGISLSRVLPNLEVQNLALSGSTSQECLDVILPKLDVQPTEAFGIVVMTTGGNDVIHLYGRAPPREGAMYGATWAQAEPWVRHFETRLTKIIDETIHRFPGGCRIFLADVYDPTDGTGDAENAGLPAWPDGLRIHTAYNAVIARVARSRTQVTLVPMHATFLGHGIHCRKFWHPHYRPEDPHYWYYDNLEDPNDRGYDALRRIFLIEMARTLPAELKSAAVP